MALRSLCCCCAALLALSSGACSTDETTNTGGGGTASGSGGQGGTAGFGGGGGVGGAGGAAGGAGGTPCVGCEDDGCCGPTCGYDDDLDDCTQCTDTLGMALPMLPCTTERPCTRLLATYTEDEITTPSEQPTCATSQSAIDDGRTAYTDGAPLSWSDADGITRYACQFRPTGTSATSKRPLLIYIHGSGGSATTVYDFTELRTKAVDYDLTGDPARPGYILLATQGRNLHWPSSQPQDGSKHDTFHRDPATNRDVAFVDHLIDELVAEDVVDPARIYLMGWSNGARFAALYGIARHATATAGGSRIAAVANYSGGDPYENIRDDHQPTCKLAAYPTSSLPFMMVSRACDAIACDQTQADGLTDAGAPPAPGNIAGNWIDDLQNVIGADVTWLRISGVGTVVNNCTAPSICTPVVATLNHVRWPDGIMDSSGHDHEPALLDHLADHPLP